MKSIVERMEAKFDSIIELLQDKDLNNREEGVEMYNKLSNTHKECFYEHQIDLGTVDGETGEYLTREDVKQEVYYLITQIKEDRKAERLSRGTLTN